MLVSVASALICVAAIVSVSIGCHDSRTRSKTASPVAPDLWLELRTIPGYPGQLEYEPVYVFTVTRDGRVSRTIDGNAAGTLAQKPSDIEELREIVSRAALVQKSYVEGHVRYVVLNVYSDGRLVGSAASRRSERHSAPCQVFSQLQYFFVRPAFLPRDEESRGP